MTIKDDKKIVQTLDVQEVLTKVLETKTRLFLGQLEYAMQDTIRHEYTINSDRADKLEDAVRLGESNINRSAYGHEQIGRGIFHSEIRQSIGFHAYALEKIISGDTTFNANYFKENGIEFDKESIEKVINSLKTLL